MIKYGKDFYKYVSIVINEFEKGIEVIKEKCGVLVGVIDIGCVFIFCGDFLFMVINKYLKIVNFKIKFNIFIGMILEIIEGIKFDKYDIGFCFFLENEINFEFILILI